MGWSEVRRPRLRGDPDIDSGLIGPKHLCGVGAHRHIAVGGGNDEERGVDQYGGFGEVGLIDVAVVDAAFLLVAQLHPHDFGVVGVPPQRVADDGHGVAVQVVMAKHGVFRQSCGALCHEVRVHIGTPVHTHHDGDALHGDCIVAEMLLGGSPRCILIFHRHQHPGREIVAGVVEFGRGVVPFRVVVARVPVVYGVGDLRGGGVAGQHGRYGNQCF